MTGGVIDRLSPGTPLTALSPSPLTSQHRPGVMAGDCYRCQRTLPDDAFSRDRTKASGRVSICRECERLKSNAYYARVKAQRAKGST